MYCRCVFIAKFCIQLGYIWVYQVYIRVVIVVLCHMMHIDMSTVLLLQVVIGRQAYNEGLVILRTRRV